MLTMKSVACKTRLLTSDQILLISIVYYKNNEINKLQLSVSVNILLISHSGTFVLRRTRHIYIIFYLATTNKNIFPQHYEKAEMAICYLLVLKYLFV